MGSCCSKDIDEKTSWSPAEYKNGSTTSTIVAQPIDETQGTGVFTKTVTIPIQPVETVVTPQQQEQSQQYQTAELTIVVNENDK